LKDANKANIHTNIAIEKLKVPITLYKVKSLEYSKATLSPFNIDEIKMFELENLEGSKLVHKLNFLS
jgi:hypothetical protein